MSFRICRASRQGKFFQIQRMDSFARPLLQAKDMQFEFNYDAAIPAINLQMDKRKNFYLIFKEAINNAIKYSCCTKIIVTIKSEHNRLELFVSDNGKGFNIDNGHIN